jgi:nucleotide-binding universal stress UspA family protein
VRGLSEVAENWLQPEYPFRKLALEQASGKIGFARATVANGLDSFFKQVTSGNLNALLIQELGHAQRLDEIVSAAVEEKLSRAAIARGPEFLVHITAGNVPNPTLMSMLLGLLTRSAQFVKCASGASLLPRLFAHSLYEADSKLGACLEVAEWRGGNRVLEDELFKAADCVTATGSDETLAAIRKHMPPQARLLSYGQRLSFGYVVGEALTGFSAKKIVARAATDIVAWNQLGCLSPHLIYVEHGSASSAHQFAELLAEELERREETEPRGNLPAEAAATIASRRGFYEVRAAHSPDTQMWCSKNSTAWTVIYEADPQFQLSCLNRFVYVKGVTDLAQALQGAEKVRGKVSTVGLAAPEERTPELAMQLARWGVTRVCSLGQMQNPPLLWRHDGRPALADLVTWTDWEKQSQTADEYR